MWYFNSETIKHPKTMVISDVTYPKTIFRDSTTLTSLGIKPMRIVTVDSRYYWDGAYTIDYRSESFPRDRKDSDR